MKSYSFTVVSCTDLILILSQFDIINISFILRVTKLLLLICLYLKTSLSAGFGGPLQSGSTLFIILSHDIASGSDTKSCIKMDKPVVVTYFLSYDVHQNVAYIMTKYAISK